MSKENHASLNKPFPCLICGKGLEAAAMADEVNANLVVTGNYGVYKGIPFATSGAYGSQILDDDSKIHFVLCDVCLLQRRHRILGTNWYDKKLKEGIHNGVELYRDWLQYIEGRGSDGYWDSIKEGVPLAE